MISLSLLACLDPQHPGGPAGTPSPSPAPRPEAGRGPDELAFYRDYTLALLHRYFRLSIEMGRLPSLLGREFFRARISYYTAQTFEDAVIFVHDVESCLRQLDAFSRQLIARVIFQDYTQDEAARLLRRRRETVIRRFPEALDQLTEIFLRTGVLRPLISPD